MSLKRRQALKSYGIGNRSRNCDTLIFDEERIGINMVLRV